jgi:undecaprenyl-diphosphatase
MRTNLSGVRAGSWSAGHRRARARSLRWAAMSEPVRLTKAQAVALGALHGPAELLPISSSAHVALVPWLLGWNYGELDGELRKTFEVALHAGTAAALLIAFRDEASHALRGSRPATVIVLSSVPPALLGYALERQVERRLGTPLTAVGGLAIGSVAMAWADRRPQERRLADARASDALYLGFAQALALVPGVSRGGATRAAARVRRFTRQDSSRLSSHIALPVIAGAALLKALRLRGRGLPPGARAPFALGAAASFASTLASMRLIRPLELGGSLMPYVVYRIGLSAVVLGRLPAKRQ